MKRISTQLVVVSVLCLGYCGGLFAQATSQISGTVKDATGGVVVGAEITVTQTDTGVTRSATSDASGVYSLPSLPLGPYRMEVKKEGFTTYVQSGIVLQVASAPAIDPVLKVGAVSQTVQVEATAPMIETSSTGVGQVVNSQERRRSAAQRTPSDAAHHAGRRLQHRAVRLWPVAERRKSGLQQELPERGAGKRRGRNAEWNHLPAGWGNV